MFELFLTGLGLGVYVAGAVLGVFALLWLGILAAMAFLTALAWVINHFTSPK